KGNPSMTLNRGTIAAGVAALATAGAVVLAPVAANAQSAPITDLKGTLLSAQSSPAVSGTAAFHASKLSTAREFDVTLRGLPPQTSPSVKVYVHGEYLASMSLSTAGSAHISLHNGVPAMQNGWTVKVSSTSGKVLCTGVLHMSPTNGGHGSPT